MRNEEQLEKPSGEPRESGIRSMLNSNFKGSRFFGNKEPFEVTKMRANASKFLVSLFWSVFFYSNSLLASEGTGMPWEGPLTKLANSLTGPVARVAGIMAIAGAGLALAMNQSDGFGRTAIRIIFGLTIAFSAGGWGLKLFGFGAGLVFP